jgi:hypothetical protein
MAGVMASVMAGVMAGVVVGVMAADGTRVVGGGPGAAQQSSAPGAHDGARR